MLVAGIAGPAAAWRPYAGIYLCARSAVARRVLKLQAEGRAAHPCPSSGPIQRLMLVVVSLRCMRPCTHARQQYVATAPFPACGIARCAGRHRLAAVLTPFGPAQAAVVPGEDGWWCPYAELAASPNGANGRCLSECPRCTPMYRLMRHRQTAGGTPELYSEESLILTPCSRCRREIVISIMMTGWAVAAYLLRSRAMSGAS